MQSKIKLKGGLMIVESTCRKCGTHFDGHWHNLKHDHIWDTVPCPKCKSKNIHVVTDEHGDAYDDKSYPQEPSEEE